MKKLKYITPACIVVEMETEEDLLLTLSQGELGGDTGAKPVEGDGDADMDAVGGGQGGYNVWDD